VTPQPPLAPLLEAVATVAQQFLSAPSFEQCAREMLAVLGQATGSSRCYLFGEPRLDAAGELTVSQLWEWVDAGISPEIANPELQSFPLLAPDFRQFGAPITRGEVVAAPVADFAPPFADLLARQQVQSLLCVPIFVRDLFWGFVGFDDCRQVRRWSSPEIDSLRAAAGVFAAAYERHRVERELRESESKYRDLFENASDLIWAIDPEGRFTTVNRAVGELLGWPAEELIGRHWEEVVSEPDQREIVRTALRDKLERRRLRTHYEVRLRRRNGGYVPVEISSRVVEREGRIVAIQGTGRDVSERRRLEEQLRQAVKMEAVGQLAAGIAREFSQLLAAINGYGERMLGRLRPADPLRAEVQEILRAGEQASELTRELMAFGRQQPARPTRIDLNDLVGQRLPTLRRIVSEDVVVVDLMEGRVGRIHADPTLVEQILVNLFVNARDAMTEGGRIEISTAVVDSEEIHRRGIASALEPRYVRLSVRDTGHGIDPSTMARIFEPFFSTRGQGRGSGLGLSTVYGIVKQCDGFIFADSHPGQGTVFQVYFPQVEEALDRRPPSGELRLAAAPSAEPRPELVLLVEDEDLIRSLAQQILAARGYQVVAAANSAEALELAGRLDRDVDLLLTDIVMPGLSGIDLAQRLLRRVPRLRVLYMSGYSDSPLLRAGLAREGAGFLQKPFSADALERRVRELLDG
jgi:PAS domain S-box-containing protein